MKEKLINFCQSLNIEYVGITPPGPYYDLKNILQERIQRDHYTGMEEADINKRIDPRLTLEDARSVIVCLFPYFTGHNKESNISKYTFSKDYHVIIMNKLEQICNFLNENIDNFHYKAFVDNGPLVDRYMAYLAGLGFYGMNNTIINDKYGSYVFIGYIINNYAFEYDKPLDKSCLDCGLCIKKCPGNVILGDYKMNPRKCISCITQKKEQLTEEEIKIMHAGEGKVFGCDICQDICPHNINAKVTPIKEFHENTVYNIDRSELESMSNREFKRKHGDRAYSWRGRKVILRNFEIFDKNQD